MSQQFYVRRGGEVFGPYSGKVLKEKANSGRFGPTDHVSIDQQQWLPAAKVKGLTFSVTANIGADHSHEATANRLPVHIPKTTFVGNQQQETASVVAAVNKHSPLFDFIVLLGLLGFLLSLTAGAVSYGVMKRQRANVLVSSEKRATTEYVVGAICLATAIDGLTTGVACLICGATRRMPPPGSLRKLFLLGLRTAEPGPVNIIYSTIAKYTLLGAVLFGLFVLLAEPFRN